MDTDWLVELDTNARSSIRSSDNNIITAEGIGKVLITKNDGKKNVEAHLVHEEESFDSDQVFLMVIVRLKKFN